MKIGRRWDDIKADPIADFEQAQKYIKSEGWRFYDESGPFSFKSVRGLTIIDNAVKKVVAKSTAIGPTTFIDHEEGVIRPRFEPKFIKKWGGS